MKDLRGRVEYLKGLSEGLALDTASKEGKMISHMLQVVGEIADGVVALASEQEDLQAYVDVLDADLQDLEEVLSDEDDDEDDDEEGEEIFVTTDDDFGIVHGTLGVSGFRTDLFTCPTCGETVQMSEHASDAARQTTEGGLTMVMLACPQCGTTFGVTEPDAVTYVEPADELTDLPYSTKESGNF
jgi:ribosomal protein S27AE